MKTFLKKMILLVPPIQTYYQNVTFLRKQNARMKLRIEKLHSQNEQLRAVQPRAETESLRDQEEQSKPDIKPVAKIEIAKQDNAEHIKDDDDLMFPNKYKAFREKFQSEKIPELALFHPSHPYGECAVIVRAEKTEQLSNLCEKENLYSIDMNGAIVLSTLEPQVDKNGATYVFSGTTRWRDHLIVGMDDIKTYDIAVSELREGIGEFELMLLTNDMFELSTDFFGLCQWYYYKSDDGIFVAATSYHLLLLSLKAVGVKMRLNTKKIAAAMALFYFSQTSFTQEMDMAGCFELPPDKRIVIYLDKEPIFENTGLYEEVHNPLPYSEELYEELLLQTKDDIIANVRAALEHPGFDYVRCDLTGGMDSRLVLAAVSNLPRSLSQRICINSGKNLVNDFKVANAIVNAFRLRWDDAPREVSCNGIGKNGGAERMYQSKDSCNLGTYCMFSNRRSFITLKKTIKLTGGCGEAMFRDFYKWIKESDTESAAESFLGRIGLNGEVDVSCSTNAAQNFNEYLRNSILSMPGESIKAKMDMFYLYFRNRHICKTKYNASGPDNPIAPTWASLQSKIAFRCKRMYFTHCIDDKFEFDLIALMNPLLASFPYENKENNRNLEKLQDCLYSKGFVQVVPDYKTSTYDLARRNFEYITDKMTVSQVDSETRQWYTNENVLLSALKTFLEYSEQFEELGLPLYRYFSNDRYTKDYGNISHAETMRINRILSAYWQIKIAEG